MAEPFLQVTTTTDSESSANHLARSVLDARLAACAQLVGPIRSRYWWKGRIEEAEEWMCLIKTTSERFPELEALLLREHSYETPEITATPITEGTAAYLRWIAEETRRPAD